MTPKSLSKGFSLVELVLAMALIIFLVATGFMMVKSFFESSTTSMIQAKANEKVKTVVAILENEATYRFDQLTETNQNRTGPRDPHIQVFSTVFPADSEGIRNVELTVIYETKPGRPVSKIHRFSLSNNRARFSGGSVRVTVISSRTLAGVAGVYVSAPGATVSRVTGVTAPDGVCQLFGVILASPTAQLEIDGQNINAYFPFPPGGQPTYKKIRSISNIAALETRDLGNEIIVEPGDATVTVLNAPDNAAAQNVVVRLYPMRGMVPPGTCTNSPNCDLGGGFDAGFPATTNGSGVATFQKLIPGQYYALVLGSAEYAAVDLNGTGASTPINRTPLLQLRTGEVVSTTRHTILKGTLKAYVHGVDFMSGSFADAGPLTKQVSFYFAINDNYSYSHSSVNPYPIQNIFSWNSSLAKNILSPGNTVVGSPVGDDSRLVLEHIAPLVINSTHTLPSATGAELQGQRLVPSVGLYQSVGTNMFAYTTPAPYLPIIVDVSRPAFYLCGGPGYSKVIPTGASLADFTFPFFSNEMSYTNASQTFGLLKLTSKTLAAATGKIGPGVAPNQFQTDNLLYHTVTAFWNPISNSGPYGGSGAVSYHSASDSYYIEAGKYVITGMSGSGPSDWTHDFNMNWVIPNLVPGDTQTFIFRAEPNFGGSYGSTPFSSNVKIFGKDLNNQTIIVPNYNSASPTINLTFKYYTGGGWMTENPMQAVSILGSNMSFSRTTYSNDTYIAAMNAHLDPATTYDFGTVPVTRNSYRRSYAVTAVDTSGQLEFIPYQNPLFAPGVPHTFNTVSNRYEPMPTILLQFAQRFFAHLHGFVRDVGGNPIQGAVVRLCGIGMATCLDATSATDGSYHIPNSSESSTFSYRTADQEYLLWFSNVSAYMYQSPGTIYIATPGNTSPISKDITLIQSQGQGGSG